MDSDRIAILLAPFLEPASLSSVQLGAAQIYLDLLLKWNAKMNLTAVRDPEEIVRRHFGESFFAATQLFPSGSVDQSAIDIGSGAGFPGLPIKIWNPQLRLTLIESNQRKATFLREAVRALTLDDVQVLSSRAETVSSQAELVTFRAVERFEQVLVIAGKVAAQSGRIAALIGESQIELARSILPEIKWQTPVPIPESRSRVLLIGQRNRL
ncbi:MAG TPA: 16S rRNA (guanine(527)-N(7))-methyltransferase RsmG [Terriglobales bacterium]|jgi:16S rRNA (guanine527-N7)-methyltransferase